MKESLHHPIGVSAWQDSLPLRLRACRRCTGLRWSGGVRVSAARVPDVLAVGTEGTLCFEPLVGDERPMRSDPQRGHSTWIRSVG
jgi:hypothetical protein